MAKVSMTPAASRQLEDLPNAMHLRALKLLERLERWPDVSGAKPLTGNLAGRYRLRTGDYRVQFSVRADIVFVERIGHRDGFYED